MFRVTYDITSPDSDGDYEESGFLDARGDRVAARVGTDTPGVGMSLREACALAFPGEDSGTWFREIDARMNYQTGEAETRSIHPPRNVSRASYARLARLFGVA